MVKRLTPEQKNRVKILLSEDSSSALFAETLALVDNPYELHNVAIKYGWDAKGEEKLQSILNHPLCDKGTALMTWWRCESIDFIYKQEEDVEYLHINKRYMYEFLKKVEALYLADNFNTNEIKYDPLEIYSGEWRIRFASYTSIPDELLVKNYGDLEENLQDLKLLRSGRLPLVALKIPSPKKLRRGWAANAALNAAYGSDGLVMATEKEWYFSDGGGNWACIRFVSDTRALMVGFDHEYTKTGVTEDTAADSALLKGAPDWWSENLFPFPGGDTIGFIYGWEKNTWKRTSYTTEDGFSFVGLLAQTKLKGRHSLTELATDCFGEIDNDDLAKLVKADAKITAEQILKITDKNTDKAIEAAMNFLLAPAS